MHPIPVLLALLVSGCAQHSEGPGAPEVFEVVEVEHGLVGGLDGLQRRLVYPEAARAAGVEGVVIVQGILSERGEVERAVVLRSPDERLNEAALVAVRASEFVVASPHRRAVRTRFSVPVTFRLPDEE